MELDILVEVIRAEDTFGRLILDAVLVMDEHQEAAQKVMIKVFEKHTGLTPQVTLG